MATVVVKHHPSGGPADPLALVDGPTYDNDPHTVTGLENVDNTSDANKPVSTAQAAADAVVAANAANASNLTSGTVALARLATVNSNVGTFGDATTDPVITVNGNGLVTAVSTVLRREVISATRIYAVSKTGSDSNTGTSTGSAAVTFANGSANIGWTAHARSAGDNFILATTGALPTNFDNATLYYVKAIVDPNTITVALTSGGAAVVAGSAGSGAHTATVYSAFLTIQKAIRAISTIDHNLFSTVAQIGGGSYPENLRPLTYVGRGIQGHNTPLIRGVSSDGTAVKVNPASSYPVLGVSQSFCEWTFKNIEFDPTGDIAVYIDAGGWVCLDACYFGGTATIHGQASTGGILEFVGGACQIIAGAITHIRANLGGRVLYATVGPTLVGTPAFSGSFADVSTDGVILATGMVFTGAATGIRYTRASGGRIVLADGVDPNSVLPGDVNGVSDAGNSSVAGGAAVALTTTVPANITSVSLPIGDYDFWVDAYVKGGATTTLTYVQSSISLVSATQDGVVGRISNQFYNGATPFASITNVSNVIGPCRISLASTSTVYFVMQAVFAVSTLSGYGILQWRRVVY